MAAKTLFDGGVASKLWLDRRKFYPDPQKVAELYSDINPFKTIMTKLGIKKVPDPVYKMFEHESTFVKRQFTSGSTVTIAADGSESNAITAGSIVGLPSSVDSSWRGLVFEVWNSTLTTKKGVCFVSSEPSSTTVKFKNAGTSAISVASGDLFIQRGGRVRGEGSVAPEAESDELSVVWNSVAYLSDSCEVTGALYEAAQLRGYSNEFARLREEMFKRFSTYEEDAYLLQVNTLGTNFDGSGTFTEANLRTLTDSKGVSGAVRMTYGYIPILENYGITWSGTGEMNEDTNIFKAPTSTFDFSKLVAISEIIFDKRESDQAFAFSGRGAITKVHQKVSDNKDKFNWVGKVQIGDTKINKLGFSMQEFETPHGILYIVPTKTLRNQYKNYMAIPDLDNIGIAEFSPVRYNNDIKKDDNYNGVKDSIEAMRGLWMTLKKRHHLLVLNEA